MNPLDLLSSQPELREANRLCAEAEKASSATAARNARVASAEADHEAAKAALSASGSAEDEARVIETANLLRNLRTVASAADPTQVRFDKLHTREAMDLLARAFDRRAELLRAILHNARKALVARYAELTMEGVRAVNFWADSTGAVQRFSQRVDQIENELNMVVMKTEHCRRTEAPNVENFDTLLSLLNQPLPAV